MHYLNDLRELCETLSREIKEANEKIRAAGGKMTSGDLEYIDRLTHALKSIKTTIAMIEAEDGESGRYYGGMPHHDSYRRGRDSMGRYTSRRGGYSYDNGMIEELRNLMNSAPDERTKHEFQNFISRIESM